jgi:hypothetical protein
VGAERGSLSLVRITEKLLGRNSRGWGLENREYGRGDPLRWPRDTFYKQTLALTSPTSGGRSVGIVRLRAKATEIFCLFFVAYVRCRGKVLTEPLPSNDRRVTNTEAETDGKDLWSMPLRLSQVPWYI